MECLINYIGLRGCGLPEPESGLYLNSLPGLTLKNLQSVANSEQVNFIGVFNEVQERAINRLIQDFTALFNSVYDQNCCADCDINEVICRVKHHLARPLLFALGMEFMLERQYSERINYYTTIQGPAEAEALRDEFQSDYKDALKASIKTIPRGLIEDCFVCQGSTVSYTENLP